MVNPKYKLLGTTTRRTFSKTEEVLDMPDLIEVQKKSYEWFVKEGLKEVLEDVSPITDHTGTLKMEFVDYSFDSKTKFSEEECKERDANYAAPLHVSTTPLLKRFLKKRSTWATSPS